MIIYKYKAIDNTGKVSYGQMEADSPVDLDGRLKNINLELISHRQVKTSSIGMFGQKKISRPELITFCFQMNQLLDAGVPLIESLHDLRDGSSNIRFKSIISTIVTNIENGKTLSEAMGTGDLGFDDIFLSLIQVGEKSGQLSRILNLEAQL